MVAHLEEIKEKDLYLKRREETCKNCTRLWLQSLNFMVMNAQYQKVLRTLPTAEPMFFQVVERCLRLERIHNDDI